MLGGGIFVGQNKKLPGTYINLKSRINSQDDNTELVDTGNESRQKIATKKQLGIVQIGDNLTITDEGILSAEVSANDIKKIEEEIQSMKDGGLGKGILRTINNEWHNTLGAVTGLFGGTSDIHPRYGTLTTYLEVE